MPSLNRTDPNRDGLILGLRAEGMPNYEIGRVFGLQASTVSQTGTMTRRHVHFLSSTTVWGLVEKYGNRVALIGGIHWGKPRTGANTMKTALVAALAGLVLSAGVVSAHPERELSRSFWNRYGTTDVYTYDTYTWPEIGTPEYSAGCSIIEFAEDGWARAYCPEDGQTYSYDPDGFAFYDHGILFRVTDPGWSVAPEREQVNH